MKFQPCIIILYFFTDSALIIVIWKSVCMLYNLPIGEESKKKSIITNYFRYGIRGERNKI